MARPHALGYVRTQMALLLKQSAVPAGSTWDLTTSVAERVGCRIIGARRTDTIGALTEEQDARHVVDGGLEKRADVRDDEPQ